MNIEYKITYYCSDNVIFPSLFHIIIIFTISLSLVLLVTIGSLLAVLSLLLSTARAVCACNILLLLGFSLYFPIIILGL